MFPSNVIGIACPGCGPNDFPVPHICGIGMTYTTGTAFERCQTCGVNYIGNHDCYWLSWMQSPPALPTTTFSCEHCWCIEERSSTRVINGQWISSYKPHDVCCACGSRRLRAVVPDGDAD